MKSLVQEPIQSNHESLREIIARNHRLRGTGGSKDTNAWALLNIRCMTRLGQFSSSGDCSDFSGFARLLQLPLNVRSEILLRTFPYEIPVDLHSAGDFAAILIFLPVP